MAKTKTTSFRLHEDVLKKLDELSRIYQIDRTSLIKRYIEQDYLKVSKVGKEKVKDYNETLNFILNNLSLYLSKENN